MSIVTELHVDGKRFKVITYDWSFNQPIDSTGRPVSKPQGGIMRILIETEKNEPFSEWAVNPTMMKNAKLIQRSVNLDGKSRIIDLVDVYCIEATDNYSSTGSKNLSTSLVLSPAQILVDGVKEMQKHWKVTDLNAQNIAPTPRNQEIQNPSLDSMSWIDDNENKKVETAEFCDKVRVFIKVTDINVGETVNVELYAKSGSDIDGSKTKTYQATVQNKLGSTYAVCEIEIGSEWGINKPQPNTNIIDTLFVKASYGGVNKDFSSDGIDVVAQKLKGIYFEKGKDKAYYYQGKLYSATQDKKGMVPYNEKPRRQFRETKEALDTIYSKSRGKKFIDDITERSNPDFITVTRKGGKNSTLGTRVSWSPGDSFGGLDVNGKTKRETFLSLAHELWHAWEYWTLPNNNPSVWIKADTKNKLDEDISVVELTASQFENEIRSEHNIPKRKWYSYTEEDGTKTGYGKIF